MRALRAVLGLLLLGALRAFPQRRAPEDDCLGDLSRYYDKAARKCCHRCREGYSPKQLCPEGSHHCERQCLHDYYLDSNDRCTACVSCSGDLVEKKPCSRNSSRVCECRAGMFCGTSVVNSCARCIRHSVCPEGMVVKLQGTAQRDTVCEPAPPGASPNCSASPQDCKGPTSGTIPQAKPTLTSPASPGARTMLLGGDIPLTPEDASKMTPNSSSFVVKLNPDPGLTLQPPCPRGSADCRKQCNHDYYLDRDGRCKACVTCSGDGLVEKTPCTWNSSRVCECQPGMFCATPVTNSCARCVTRPNCPPGMVTKLQGMAETGTTYEPLPPGSPPDCSTSPEDREAPASPTPSLVSLADSLTGKEHGGGVTHAWEDTPGSTSAPISFSSTGKPALVSGPVLFWVILMLVVVVSFSSFVLCHRRACRKWIGQKLHLCYPVQTFRPTLEPVDSKPGRNPILTKSVSVADPGNEEQGLLSRPAMETCLESLRLLEASPVSSPPSPTDLPEPRGTMEHTNNRIENIYIMKADTVIVGTVKAEVPEGQGPVGPAGPELEEELETDYASHYPEQETEPPLGSCGDVMFSVEEEGKEDPLPTTVSDK
ncbi:tumor necrosis factor receptor superfamily member 8 [Bos indicus x Bos taurus]|uniref:TNF receptor superfamily member 8 n=2 Tax=Bos TaxID=9903 RepID=F1N0U5_BOVIN|nr:tumor necrosis factor receptor superfamily member 8 [Bos taurus]XP_027420661.1 tumor necrosis factor receptor superfamily member 8 [Bos indicus x Bos taurus]